MYISDCFIDTTDNRRNLFIPITFDNTKPISKKCVYIRFQELITEKDFEKIKDSKEFQDLDISVQSNIGIVCPSFLNMKELMEKVDKLEGDFEVLFKSNEEKTYNEKLYMELVYSEGYKEFLNKILNEKIYEYKNEIKLWITYLKKDRIFLERSLEQYVDYYIKNINKKIKKVSEEIDNLL